MTDKILISTSEYKDYGQITIEDGVDPGGLNPCIFLGKIHPEQRGKYMGFHLLMDYHIYRDRRGNPAMCCRPVADRAKYPNWPKPEPDMKRADQIAIDAPLDKETE